MSITVEQKAVEAFLNEINKGLAMGFYTKGSLRFDEIFLLGRNYIEMHLGGQAAPFIVTRSQPVSKTKKDNKK